MGDDMHRDNNNTCDAKEQDMAFKDGTNKKKIQKKKGRKNNPWNVDDKDYDIELNKLKNSFLKGKHKLGKKNKNIYKGPCIHIRGRVDNPQCETIVNRVEANNSKESNKRPNKSIPLAKADIHHKQTNTQSANRWDASQVDHTWVCVFCGKQHYVAGLGLLFGPYIVNAKNSPIKIPTDVNEICAKRSMKESLRYLKRTECIASAGLKKKKSEKMKGSSDSIVLDADMSEVWVHQDCLIWSDGVFWVPGGAIRGLQESVLDAARMKCSFCTKTGANVGCIGRGCQKKYHYICARDRGCLLDHDSFTIYCPKHRLAGDKAREGSGISFKIEQVE